MYHDRVVFFTKSHFFSRNFFLCISLDLLKILRVSISYLIVELNKFHPIEL